MFPAIADIDSIKVRSSDKKTLTIMGVRTQSDFFLKSGNPELQKHQDRRKTHRDCHNAKERAFPQRPFARSSTC